MRSTCLYCAQNGVSTPLTRTVRGGVCPVCSGDFIDQLERQARFMLGLPDPASIVNRRGRPAPRPS